MSAIDVSSGSRVVENRPAEAYAWGIDPGKGAIFGNGTRRGRYPRLLGIMPCYRTV